MFSMKMIGDKVLIEGLQKETVTKGGVHIPDSAVANTGRGIVRAVGPGLMIPDKNIRIPTEVKEGDIVIFPQYERPTRQEDGKDYYILSESELHGIEIAD